MSAYGLTLSKSFQKPIKKGKIPKDIISELNEIVRKSDFLTNPYKYMEPLVRELSGSYSIHLGQEIEKGKKNTQGQFRALAQIISCCRTTENEKCQTIDGDNECLGNIVFKMIGSRESIYNEAKRSL